MFRSSAIQASLTLNTMYVDFTTTMLGEITVWYGDDIASPTQRLILHLFIMEAMTLNRVHGDIATMLAGATTIWYNRDVAHTCFSMHFVMLLTLTLLNSAEVLDRMNHYHVSHIH